jgi:hypothetical protein
MQYINTFMRHLHKEQKMKFEDFMLTLITGILIGGLLFGSIIYNRASKEIDDLRHQAVERGYGVFNPVVEKETTTFTWK